MPSYTNSPATAANSPTGGTAWLNLTNIGASDDARVTCTLLLAGDESRLLLVDDFGFAIPSTETVVGVEVAVERSASTSSAIRDVAVQLLLAGVASGSDKADTANPWPTSDTTKTYGGASDTWGLSLTVADINHSDFGVQLRVVTDANAATARVDHVQITVYTVPAVADNVFNDDPLPFRRSAVLAIS